MLRYRCVRCQADEVNPGYERWRCGRCGAEFPVVRGVPRFVGQDHYSASFGYQWNRFDRTQLDSANGTTRSHDAFFQKTGWQPAELCGRRVLDAGCGMGRFAEICAEARAEVHAVDSSEAVDACRRNLAHHSNVFVYQADIMSLPFADGSFDLIYSIGVLHHTPNTRAAFERLVPLLAPGGQIAVWVYSSRLRRSVGGELLRPLTRALPRRLLFALCRVAVPLYYVHRIPVLGRAVYMCLPTSLDSDSEWRWLDTFDWYSPRYHWKHTPGEVLGWFREAGLTDIRQGPFPVSVGARRPAV